MYKIMQDGLCLAKGIETLWQACFEARSCLSFDDDESVWCIIVDQESGKEIARLTLEVSIERL